MGGLGNQMFQYAAGRFLAWKQDVPLFVDSGFLEADPAGKYTKRKLELDQLHVKLIIADKRILKTFRQGRFRSLLRSFSHGGKTTILSDTHRFNEAFLQTGNSAYLNGFWQSELYFIPIRSLLLEEFTPNFEFSADETKLRERIQSSSNSVAIHVRRGDYVNHAEASQFHGVCDMNYYDAAILYVKSRVELPEFFIFSDDIGWCRSNFGSLANCIFVETKSAHAATDLFLMAECNHNIIANSSYSWWSAWLNKNEKKMVIAPKSWFREPNFNPDIYCSNWIRR